MSANEVSAIYSAGANGKLKQAAFTAQNSVKIAAATVNFPSAQNGTANEQSLDPANLPPITNGTPKLYYDVSTNANSSGASVCFNVAALSANFANLKVYHLENNVWVDLTGSANTSPNLCTTALPSFSPFAIVQVTPTAANVSVSGRITTANGRGIQNATMVLTKADGTTQIARTGSFGYYNFSEVAAGQTVIISVEAKRFKFIPNTKLINIADNIADADFMAVESN